MKAILIQLGLAVFGLYATSKGDQVAGSVYIVGSFVVMALRKDQA